MGTPKPGIVLGGRTLAERVAGVLAGVCDPVLEIGPGVSPLPALQEDPPGRGPLAALAAGGRALRDRHGWDGPVVVLATDMPFLSAALLVFLRDHPAAESVVPVAGGRAQVLCARWSSEAVAAAEALVDRGERAMSALLAAAPHVLLDEQAWRAVADVRAFTDLDTPDDLARAAAEMVAEAGGGAPRSGAGWNTVGRPDQEGEEARDG